MKANYNSLFITLLMIGTIVTLSACGGNNQETNQTSENNGESSEKITLDSEMGEVTLPKSPEKILAPYNEDSLLALGVTPIAKWSIGEGVQDYLEANLEEVPAVEWNLPLEDVLEYEPDLIILENNLDGYVGTYEDYNKIAPTYVMTKETTEDWRQQIEVFGEVLGTKDQAVDVLKEYESNVDEASEQLKEGLNGESVAAIWVKDGKYFLFEENRHSAEVLYSELGLTVPELVKELGEAGEEWNPLSIEKLSELDADHVFLLADEGEEGLETLTNSSVWQGIPAAQKNQVYHLQDGSAWTNKGLMASQQTIDDLIDTLIN